MKAFGTATGINGRYLAMAVGLTLLLCLPISAQVGKKGQVNPQPDADAPKTSVPAKKKTTAKATSPTNRSRGNAARAGNVTGAGGSTSSLTQKLAFIKKSFESERPLPVAQGPAMFKNEAFEFDDCSIRTKTSSKGVPEGDYLSIETFDLTDIDPASIGVSQYGEFERKTFDVNYRTFNEGTDIRRVRHYAFSAEEQQYHSGALSFKEKATAERIAKELQQAVTLCRNQ